MVGWDDDPSVVLKEGKGESLWSFSEHGTPSEGRGDLGIYDRGDVIHLLS